MGPGHVWRDLFFGEAQSWTLLKWIKIHEWFYHLYGEIQDVRLSNYNCVYFSPCEKGFGVLFGSVWVNSKVLFVCLRFCLVGPLLLGCRSVLGFHWDELRWKETQLININDVPPQYFLHSFKFRVESFESEEKVHSSTVLSIQCKREGDLCSVWLWKSFSPLSTRCPGGNCAPDQAVTVGKSMSCYSDFTKVSVF